METNSRRTSATKGKRSVPCRADPRNALPADVVSKMSTLKPNLLYSLIGPVYSGVETLGRCCDPQNSPTTFEEITPSPLRPTLDNSKPLRESPSRQSSN